MELEFDVEGQTYELEVDYQDGKYLVRLGDKQYDVDCQPISKNCLSLLADGKAYTVFIAEDEGKRYISVQGEEFCIEEATTQTQGRSLVDSTALKGAPTIASPMPGKIVKILTKEGDKVGKAQGLVIVEAMKMENELRSPAAGVVKKINFKEGDLVDAAELIIELELEEGS